MNRILFAAFLLLLLGSTVSAQVGPPPPPPNVEKAPTAAAADKPAEKPPDYSREPFVIEQLRTAMRFENDGSKFVRQTARVRVQDESGVQQLGQLVWGYNSGNEHLDVEYVRVIKADGSIVTAGPDAVQDLSGPVSREAPMYTDYRQKHVTVPALRPGETLEYSYTITQDKPLAPGQFWADHDFVDGPIVLDEELEINVPRDRAIKLKTRPGYEPKITEEGDRKIYLWTSSHLKRDDDDDATANKDKKKKKKKEPEAPAVQMSTFASWDEVGRWYAGLERDRREVTPAIEAKAKALIAGHDSDMDKIEALYDYVAKNYRYVSLSFGTGRYQPHAAAEIFANQYGDCKDKNTLLAALLRAAGYNSNSVLINSSRKIDPDVPSPGQFDHVITQALVGKEKIWLDTTTEVAPFRLLAFPLRKKQALVVVQNGKSQLEETPADPPFPNTSTVVATGEVNNLGKLTLHQKETLRGDMELALRMIFRRTPETRWKAILQYAASVNGIDGEITDYKVSDPADTHKPFEIDLTLSEPNFLDWTKKKSNIAIPLGKLNLPDADEDSDEPIKLGVKMNTDESMTIKFPEKYKLRLPMSISVKRDYAEYSTDYKLDGNTVIITRKYVSRMDEIPASRYNDYQAFRRACLSDADQTLGVEGEVAGADSVPAGTSADELFDAAVAASKDQNYTLAVGLYKKVLEVDPKHKYTWANLGYSYQMLGQYDSAINAYKKQLESDPYDNWTWNSLGTTYSAKRDYDEAVKAFDKLIELNPLDKNGHRNLGNTYLEQKKYTEAAGELEKAVSISPDDAMVQLNLGRAYLNLGENQKAMAAFDQAVQLSPTPSTWNGVAYELSLKKVELDRARQYAESAVDSTATVLRNMNLSSNQLQQQILVSVLSASWDTLGWVHFQKGDYATALKYVRASWLLAPNGEVGDHLGQIYEKLGDKGAAIHAYALALAATRPMPETRPRLAALLGEESKIDKEIQKVRPELLQLRTVKLPRMLAEDATADFYVVKASGSAVHEVKFIGGSEKLKPFEDTLRTMADGFEFPDENATRIVRRGTLTCSASAQTCSFVFLSADTPFGDPADGKKQEETAQGKAKKAVSNP